MKSIMKKVILSAVLAIVAFALGSCEKESEGLTRITYYPVLTLEGDQTIYLDKGTPYVEPGYSANLNGEDVTDQVIVTSNVDCNVSGIYSISYSITNVDGFSSQSSRKVIVLDSKDPIEGIYVTQASSFRTYNGATVLYKNEYSFLVINKGDSYEFEDLFGGWYSQRAGYGSNYNMKGHVTFDASNKMTLVDSKIAGWGDSLDGLEDGSFDPATGTLSFISIYNKNTMEFHITAIKQ